MKYKEIKLRKRSGGSRLIEIPCKELRVKLDNILKYIKTLKLAASPYSHAFVYKRNIRTHLLPHRKSKFFHQIDLKCFFHSVTIDMINGIPKHELEVCFHKGRLPMGSPTSPMLSNLATREMDYRLGALCKKYGIIYSRYADDMVFSSKTSKLMNYRSEYESIIKDCKFTINKQKTKIVKDGKPITAAGLILSNGKISIPQRIFKKIRAAKHQKNWDSALGLASFCFMADDRLQARKLINDINWAKKQDEGHSL